MFVCFYVFNTFFLLFSGIQAATDDYLVIKSRAQRNEQYYRVPNGLRRIGENHTYNEVSPGIFNRIEKKNSFFVIDSWSDESNNFSIEFFPLLQKHKETKDGLGHTSFLVPKEQIQAFEAVLCPLSKGLLKQSIIAQLGFKKKDFHKEFYKETVEKDVLHSQSWNKAIVQSVQYLDSIKCNNDDLTNAFILLDFLKSSFAITQVLINCLYDKDLIDDVIDGNDQAKTDFLKKYLLTNQLFHVSKEYLSIQKILILPEYPLPKNFEMLYDLSDEELRYFNCQNITLPENSFLKTYIINVSNNKIKEIAFFDFDIFNPKIKIIFDFRGNPLSLKTKKIFETLRKRYPKELVRAQKKIDGSFLQSENYKSNVFLMHKFEQQIKDLDTDFVNVFLQISNLKSQAEGKKLLKTQTLSDQKLIKMCAIISSFVLFGLSLYNHKCIFIMPLCIAFFIKKFMDIVQRFKTIEIDLGKISFDIKKNEIQQETILKIQNNIKKSLSKIKIEQNQIKINQELHNYHQNMQQYDFESSLIKNSWYILYDK